MEPFTCNINIGNDQKETVFISSTDRKQFEIHINGSVGILRHTGNAWEWVSGGFTQATADEIGSVIKNDLHPLKFPTDDGPVHSERNKL